MSYAAARTTSAAKYMHLLTVSMIPIIRKLVRTAHVTFTIGWLGVVAAFLVLAITGIK